MASMPDAASCGGYSLFCPPQPPYAGPGLPSVFGRDNFFHPLPAPFSSTVEGQWLTVDVLNRTFEGGTYAFQFFTSFRANQTAKRVDIRVLYDGAQTTPTVSIESKDPGETLFWSTFTQGVVTPGPHQLTFQVFQTAGAGTDLLEILNYRIAAYRTD